MTNLDNHALDICIKHALSAYPNAPFQWDKLIPVILVTYLDEAAIIQRLQAEIAEKNKRIKELQNVAELLVKYDNGSVGDDVDDMINYANAIEAAKAAITKPTEE